MAHARTLFRVPTAPLVDKLRRLEENKKLLLLGDAEADARESHLKTVASKYDDADDDADDDASSDSESDRCVSYIRAKFDTRAVHSQVIHIHAQVAVTTTMKTKKPS